jgi:hypothetical protein
MVKDDGEFNAILGAMTLLDRARPKHTYREL